MTASHIPVLLDEVIAALAPQPGDVIVDATFGAGGYSRALLDAGATVHAFDRDLRSMQLWGFEQVPFDASGRFVLPDHLAGLGNLRDEVFFHGAGEFFTLWNPETLYAMGEGWEGPQAACRKLSGDAGKSRK